MADRNVKSSSLSGARAAAQNEYFSVTRVSSPLRRRDRDPETVRQSCRSRHRFPEPCGSHLGGNPPHPPNNSVHFPSLFSLGPLRNCPIKRVRTTFVFRHGGRHSLEHGLGLTVAGVRRPSVLGPTLLSRPRSPSHHPSPS